MEQPERQYTNQQRNQTDNGKALNGIGKGHTACIHIHTIQTGYNCWNRHNDRNRRQILHDIIQPAVDYR